MRPDYARQYEESDLVAIVLALEASENGGKKEMEGHPEVKLREVVVKLKTLNTLKGKTTERFECKFYRFPTSEEFSSDNPNLGIREAVPFLVLEHGLGVPIQSRDYLVYLQVNEDGEYLPTAGIFMSKTSTMELHAPNVVENIKKQIKDLEPGETGQSH